MQQADLWTVLSCSSPENLSAKPADLDFNRGREHMILDTVSSITFAGR